MCCAYKTVIMCLTSIPLLEHCARAVCVLNVVAIVYITHTGSNLLNDIIVAYVNVPPHASFTWTASDDILRGIVPRYRLSSILMSRFLLNLRRHRTRSATGRQSMTLTPSMGISPSGSLPSDRTSPCAASHSMGRSMMSDDSTDHDSADPRWDIELQVVAIRRVPDSRRYDALASVSTAATLTASWPSKELLVPGDKGTVGADAEPVDRRPRD